MQKNPANLRQADTFICHASEDKTAIARPLHEALENAGVNSWLDESEIRLGQSIRQEIDRLRTRKLQVSNDDPVKAIL